MLKRAIQFWDTSALVAPVSFVAHLGDVLASEARAAPPAALAAYREAAGRSRCAQWHVAVGAHDLDALGALGVAALAPMRPAAPAAPFYAFAPAAGWRVLVLDAFDVSLVGAARGSAGHAAALATLTRENPAVASAVAAHGDPLAAGVADPLAGLDGYARRFGQRGGGLSDGQLGWLREQLSLAEEASERALVLCHLGCLRDGCAPEALLFNCDEARAVLDSYPGVVAAWLSGADPTGGYARDLHGVHHVALCSAARCGVNEDAFGALQVYDSHMALRMVGRPPNPASRPQGWPETLNLPRTGKMVAAAAGGVGGTGFFFALISMWMAVLQTLLVPMEPLFRMLTNSGARDEAPAAEPARGSVALGRVPATQAAGGAVPVVLAPPPPGPGRGPPPPPPAAQAANATAAAVIPQPALVAPPPAGAVAAAPQPDESGHGTLV